MRLFALLVLCFCSHGHCHTNTSRVDQGLFEIIQQLVHGQQVILERTLIVHAEISDLKSSNTHMEQQIGDLKSSNTQMELQIGDLNTFNTHMEQQIGDLKTLIMRMEQQMNGSNTDVDGIEQSTQIPSEVCETHMIVQDWSNRKVCCTSEISTSSICH